MLLRRFSVAKQLFKAMKNSISKNFEKFLKKMYAGTVRR